MARSAPLVTRRRTAQELADLARRPVGDLRYSDATLQEVALDHADAILQVWKDLIKGAALDLDSYIVLAALAWLQVRPSQILAPKLANASLSSEAYFVLWAYTGYGDACIRSWERLFPGLKYRRTFPDFEIQRFLRELMTNGTKLSRLLLQNCPFGHRFTVTQMMAVACLKSRTRSFSKRDIRRNVLSLFGRGMPAWWRRRTFREVGRILKQEDMNFDNDFPVRATTYWGSLKYSLGPGHENLLLEDRFYSLGSFTPAASPNPTLDGLPDELQVMTLRYLYKFPTAIHVRVHQSGRYKFAMFAPHDDDAGPLPDLHDHQVGPIRDLFNFSEVSWRYRELALQVFYAENKFVLGPFPDVPGQTDSERYHLIRWLIRIGPLGRRFLRVRNVSLA